MQLEFNFNPTLDLQTTTKQFFNTLYGILIWMQILSNQ